MSAPPPPSLPPKKSLNIKNYNNDSIIKNVSQPSASVQKMMEKFGKISEKKEKKKYTYIDLPTAGMNPLPKITKTNKMSGEIGKNFFFPFIFIKLFF